jgi:hypothetical protein
MEKKKEQNLSVKSFIPAAGLAGLGFAASTADKQLAHINQKLESWDQSLNVARETTKDRGITFADADDIFERYTRGGQELASSKFLGARSGSYVQAVNTAGLLRDKLLKNILHIPDNKLVERQHTIDHYQLYKNPATTPEALKHHMIEKGLGDPSMKGADKSLRPETKKILADIGTYPTLEQQHSAIKSIAPENAKVFHKAILGEGETIGEARRLAGNTRDVMSTPEVYKIHLQPHINTMRYVASRVAKGSAIGAGVLGGGLVLSQLFKKEASRDKEDVKHRTLGTAGVVLGTPLASIGASRIVQPHKDIAITYGVMPAVGLGHKSPGQAIHKLIKGDKRFKDINIDLLERDEHHIFRSSPKGYALSIDTGLGGIGTSWADKQGLGRTHGMDSPKLRAAEHLRYQTDLLDEAGGGSGSTLQGRGGRVLAYGEGVKRKLKSRGFKGLVVSDRYTPALDPDAIKEISTFDDKPIFDKILEHEQTNLSSLKDETARKWSEDTIAQLNKHKHKKFITVSGASRGDYVGIRAKELAEALDKASLSKEYAVVAQLGRGRGKEQEALVSHSNIIRTGFMPRHLHNELQSKSVINWSNTGASTVGENMLMKNVQAYPKEWGYNYSSDQPISGSIAHRQDAALGTRGTHVHIDEWNKGTKPFLRKQKGVLEANTADDIINALKEPGKLQNLSTEAGARAAERLKETNIAASKLVDTIHSEYRRGKTISRLKGAIPAVIGGALLVGGVHNLLQSYKHKELKKVDISVPTTT